MEWNNKNNAIAALIKYYLKKMHLKNKHKAMMIAKHLST